VEGVSAGAEVVWFARADDVGAAERAGWEDGARGRRDARENGGWARGRVVAR
jgi:hypothetical protein